VHLLFVLHDTTRASSAALSRARSGGANPLQCEHGAILPKCKEKKRTLDGLQGGHVDILGTIFYSAGVLIIYTILSGVFFMLETILNNWDTIGLILSNIVALFINPPRRKKP
jgi:hypothetical protein